MNAPAAVLGNEEIALRINRDAVRLDEFAGKRAGAPESRQSLAGRALENLDLRFVLRPLSRIDAQRLIFSNRAAFPPMILSLSTRVSRGTLSMNFTGSSIPMSNG